MQNIGIGIEAQLIVLSLKPKVNILFHSVQ
jgi:hypothetical protein